MHTSDNQIDDLNARLENLLIDQFLEMHGHTRHSLRALGSIQADTLFGEAVSYASRRLADIESKAHYVGALHQRFDAH